MVGTALIIGTALIYIVLAMEVLYARWMHCLRIVLRLPRLNRRPVIQVFREGREQRKRPSHRKRSWKLYRKTLPTNVQVHLMGMRIQAVSRSHVMAHRKASHHAYGTSDHCTGIQTGIGIIPQRCSTNPLTKRNKHLTMSRQPTSAGNMAGGSRTGNVGFV